MYGNDNLLAPTDSLDPLGDVRREAEVRDPDAGAVMPTEVCSVDDHTFIAQGDLHAAQPMVLHDNVLEEVEERRRGTRRGQAELREDVEDPNKVPELVGVLAAEPALIRREL